MIYNKKAPLIPRPSNEAHAPPVQPPAAPVSPPRALPNRKPESAAARPETTTNTAAAATIGPAEPARNAASTGADLANHVDAPAANSRTGNTPAALPLELFGSLPPPDDRSQPSDQPVIEPLPGDDDIARFINAMQRRNQAGEIAAVGFVSFSETENWISANVTGWLSSGRREADLKHLATEVEHSRGFKKTLRVARRRDDAVPDGIRDWTRSELEKLRAAYERGPIEGLCAVVYGADGSARLFSKSTLSVSNTLMALDALRGLPYYEFSPVPGGFVTDRYAQFSEDVLGPPRASQVSFTTAITMEIVMTKSNVRPVQGLVEPAWLDRYAPEHRDVLREHGIPPASGEPIDAAPTQRRLEHRDAEATAHMPRPTDGGDPPEEPWVTPIVKRIRNALVRYGVDPSVHAGGIHVNERLVLMAMAGATDDGLRAAADRLKDEHILHDEEPEEEIPPGAEDYEDG